MSIVKSDKRSTRPISFKISKDIMITSTGIVNINVPFIVNHVDFFPSSFKLEIFEKVIYIDPVIVEEDKSADYILITHAHQDHFSMKDIKRLLKKETIVICPKQVYKKISKELKGYKIVKTKPGDKMSFGNIGVESIGAYNLKSGFLVPHPKCHMNVGYIISSGDIKIYHTGDTDYTSEMRHLKNITLVLTPIDGDNLTMTTEKAAEFVNHIEPHYVIPMHYNTPTDETERLKKLINKNIKVVVMEENEIK